ncbi:MAG TPA: carboxymuconolactone decarboxylase family protein [Gemmatimonadaceae bacterium]|nr:carboxymuconolactone decarboxylase family protein [Gemmatimonadaceae bacterium]
MLEPTRQFKDFVAQYPEVGRAHEAFGVALAQAGPLDARGVHLVKLGIAMGMQHEGAVHAHTRKALSDGITPDELRHAAVLAATTLGWPRMIAAFMWVEDELREHGSERTVSTDGMG